MGLDNLYADIAARYARLNESLSKGRLTPDSTSSLSHQYAWPVSKDAGTLGMATLASAERQLVDDTEKSIPFIISTQEADRDGDIVVSQGGLLGPYSQNPIVLFGHGSWQVPIGTARGKDGQLCVWMEESRVRAKVFFDCEDPDADFIYGKVKRGMLNATSISFLPRQAYQRERGKAYHDEMSPLGWVFEAWELTEFSVVAIPANAGALRDSYDSEKSFITPKLQKALQPYLAKAKDCFTGYCPCPPCDKSSSSEERIETREETMTTLTSGLPGSKKKKKSCGCGGKCSNCKGMETPGANSGQAAANNPQGEHAHEEESTSSVHDDARAKLPKLIEAGYPRDVACCMAVHMAHAGSKGEDINGHESVAEMYKDMGESSGSDGGYAGGEEMSLKSLASFVHKDEGGHFRNECSCGKVISQCRCMSKSKKVTVIKNGCEECRKGEQMDRDDRDPKKSEDKPETEAHAKLGKEKPEEDEAEEGGKKRETEDMEEVKQYKPSAEVLGNMHNHMKAAHEYLSKTLPTMDHEEIGKAMESHLPDLEGHMGDYEKLVAKHHKGVKMDALCKHCKSLAEGDPERKVVDNQDGSKGKDDADSAQPKRDTGGDKTGTELMRENQEAKLSPAAIQKMHESLDKLDAFVFAKAGLHV